MANAEDLDIDIDGMTPPLQTRPRRFEDRATRGAESQPEIEDAGYEAPAEPVRVDEPAPAPERPRRKKARAEARRDDTPRTPAIIRFFTDERTRVFLAIALVLLSIYMVISIVSYFRHGATDQSEVMHSTLSEIAANDSVGNVTGGFGAKLSHLLMCDTLGLGSLVTIVYFWILALGLLDIRKCRFWSATFKCMLLAITISLVLGLLTYNTASEIYWGGNHGHYINKVLIDHTSWIGAIGVSVLLVVAVCCVYLNELRHLWGKWKAVNERRRMREELRRQRMRDLEDELDDEPEDEEPEARVNASPAAATYSAAQAPAAVSMPQPQPQTQPQTQTQTQAAQPAFDEIIIPDSPAAAAVAAAQATPAAPETIIEEGFSITAPEIEIAEEIADKPADDGLYDHRAELSRYRFPSIDLLEDRPSGPTVDIAEQQANKDRIVKTLLDYRIPISRIEATVGPTVTLYEVVPAEGVRIAQIKRLEDDIALSLSALGIRIIAPIPGKGTVGIEVPNSDPKTVSMRAVITSKKYQECKMALPMAMGATISNEIFIADLAKMPHLLVAGATGMGKSVGLNAIIASLLYKKHPSELKFVLVDPKMVEFSLYSKLERHFLAKLPGEDNAIITDMDKVLETLNSLCVEMDQRYELLRDANVRSLDEYNRKFTQRRLNPEKGHRYLPYIVVIVDEFADIIMTRGKEVETPIARIAQKARAVGIHMILATQRPSTNVITGLIKANFPGRIAFRVIQMVDSRTILDCPGANQLIGRGDMLFSHNGNMQRVQCAFIDTEEVEALTQYIDDQVGYEHAYYLPEAPMPDEGGALAGAGMERDAIFDEAARFVVSRQMGSTSSLQRQFGIGYNRAGKLMDQMEAAGIVGPVNGAKPRAILVDMVALEKILE